MLYPFKEPIVEYNRAMAGELSSTNAGAGARRPSVFVSSVLTGTIGFDDVLKALRSEIKLWADDAGYDAWLFEDVMTETQWNGVHVASAERFCLKEVDGCDLFVGIYRAGYGGTARQHRAGIGRTDLEFFEAFRKGKPIRLYILDSDQEIDERLKDLLRVVRLLAPGSFGCAGSASRVLEAIKRDVNMHFEGRGFAPAPHHVFREFGRYVQSAWSARHALDQKPGRFNLLSLPCTPNAPFVANKVQDILTAVSSHQESHDVRLGLLLDGVHLLFDAPYFTTDDPVILDLWDRVLSQFEVSAAWRGLHGFPWDGRLAALNSLFAVRAIRAAHAELAAIERPEQLLDGTIGCSDQWMSLLSLGGSLGSEYYSTAKLVSHEALRNTYLDRSISWLTIAERRHSLVPDPISMAGIIAIRGHVRLALHQSTAATADFERSLRLRQEGGADERSICEAMVDLGHVMVRSGGRARGERMLLEGVHGLEAAGAAGFAARAKMKLADYYVRRGAFFHAIRQLQESDAICRLHGIVDRDTMAGSLSSFALRQMRRFWPGYSRLKAIHTPNGYQFTRL